ncbi:hypothetical protein A3J90_07035 [candidate division WOR-1 bacterium RIFOXYC2_FULL_37_10]|uniref:AFP-like domain-containing protein n=1 Tax=candidate division WOR-1 bacterium RIFOXYB2_FULL_37_13 TaxID=1802579 RepID=A0A1F4SQ84_UNCSA|nr:MAG: hypothetical protein A2310_07600 [candidate division WOR-1 bacterium RIFOXYB2_FULL_37_13]OGC34238.1 MAG: hypothetical protein A3J90_07035 [candidate division WOR-1 bacterium RIFOXYC2_FULL_37_10]
MNQYKDDLFFVIEEGQANLGSFDKALSMIDAACFAGADAIEFQLARANDFYVRDNPNFKTYLDREFTDLQIKKLVAYAKSKEINFIAAPLSCKIIDLLVNAGCFGFNINASDINNPDILDAVANSGLFFCLSTLMADEKEIDWAVNRISKNGRCNFALLHGQHTMASGDEGVQVRHTSLGYINVLKNKYQVPVGFIDHTPFAWMPVAAVAAGADIVTKHIAISKAEKGPDWQVCLEPDEMKKAIIFAKEMKESIKVKNKILAPGENIDRSIMRRSIVASRVIASNNVISREDIEFKRPGAGIDPSKYEMVIGKITNRTIMPDEQINLSDLKEKL